MTTERNRSACFTGHRLLGAQAARMLPERLDNVIRRLYGEGIRFFYAGGAVGFDMIAAERVLAMKKELPEIRLLLALPCLTHDKHWSAGNRARSDRIKKECDLLVYVSTAYTPECMHVRNRYMADRSCVCVSFYDGRPGGTEKTRSYAKAEGLRLIELADPSGIREE